MKRKIAFFYPDNINYSQAIAANDSGQLLPFSTAETGFFLDFGTFNGETKAIVETRSGKIVTIPVFLIQFASEPDDFIQTEIIRLINSITGTNKKSHELSTAIMNLLKNR